MAHQHHRGRYHPSRINGILKFNVCMAVNNELLNKSKHGLIVTPINLNIPDWSVKTPQQQKKGKGND